MKSLAKFVNKNKGVLVTLLVVAALIVVFRKPVENIIDNKFANPKSVVSDRVDDNVVDESLIVKPRRSDDGFDTMMPEDYLPGDFIKPKMSPSTRNMSYDVCRPDIMVKRSDQQFYQSSIQQ